jgi:hypothetical protein
MTWPTCLFSSQCTKLPLRFTWPVDPSGSQHHPHMCLTKKAPTRVPPFRTLDRRRRVSSKKRQAAVRNGGRRRQRLERCGGRECRTSSGSGRDPHLARCSGRAPHGAIGSGGRGPHGAIGSGGHGPHSASGGGRNPHTARCVGRRACCGSGSDPDQARCGARDPHRCPAKLAPSWVSPSSFSLALGCYFITCSKFVELGCCFFSQDGSKFHILPWNQAVWQ